MKGTASWFFGAIRRAVTFDLTFNSNNDIESKQSESESAKVEQNSNESAQEIIVDVEIELEMSRRPKLKGKRHIARLRQEIANQHAEIALLKQASEQQDSQIQLKAERKEIEERLLENLRDYLVKLAPEFEALQMSFDGAVWSTKISKLENENMKALVQEFNDIKFLLEDNFYNAADVVDRTKKLGEDVKKLQEEFNEATKPKTPKPLVPKLPDKPGQLDGLEMEVWETALKQLKTVLEQPKKEICKCCGLEVKKTCGECGGFVH